jgi:hypothetical protein
MLSRIFFVIGGIAVGGYFLNVLINPGDALPRNARMGEWREARVRPDCYQAVDDLKDPKLPQLPSAPNKIDFGDFSRTVQMTAAFNCYVVTQRDAICEPNNRAWIVDYAGKYYSKLDSMMVAAERHGEAEIKLVKQTLNSERNRAIAAAMENNIRDGRLTKADFGWSMPASLKPLFDKYPSATDKCPPLRTAEAK